MVVINAIYPNKPGGKFDADYYRDKHMPLVKRVLGSACKGVSYASGITGADPGSEPSFIAIGTVYFDSLEDFQTAFPPQAQQIMADIPNYTDIEPVIQISDVRLHDLAEGVAARA
jgi:uncharacterized protein (TIGR02118 family)